MHADGALEASKLEQELLALDKEAKKALKGSLAGENIETVRVRYLGKKGKVSELLKLMGRLPVEERPKLGQVANKVKTNIESYLEAALERLSQVERESLLSHKIDVTLPARLQPKGHLHPLTQAAQDIVRAFEELGFDLVQGPEIEHDFYNFEALNVPSDHPAREMQDTFYVAKDVVLRTHTSPVQVRSLLADRELPTRIVSLGRVYRRDQDVTHSPMFHQVECLYVDKQVTFADLKGTLLAFVRKLFSVDTKIRLRPSYFPFTEPSAEVDMSCFACKGNGCRLCKETGWIEILGSGMVDPEVLKAAQLDPEKVSGFALGLGVERVAMLRYGINDIRLFYENDVRFLRQF